LDNKQVETRICLLASILLLGFASLKIYELKRELVAEQIVHAERCVAAARHKLNARGTWSEDYGACTVKMRFRSNAGSTTAFYEQDVPIDQLPPPRA
jgi:hypothetical protein